MGVIVEEEKKEKKYYRIKVEGTAPVVINYRVLAESPEEAIEMTKNVDYSKMDGVPKPNLKRLKKSRSTAYLYGTIIIKDQKNH